MDPRQQRVQQTEWMPISEPGLPENTICRYTVSEAGQVIGRELQVHMNGVWHPFADSNGPPSNNPRNLPDANQTGAYGQQSYGQQSYGQASTSAHYATAGGDHRRQLAAAGIDPGNAAANTHDGGGDRNLEDYQELDFNGTEGEKEDLDQRYRRRSDPRSFFKKGRCFMMLIADASGRPQMKRTMQEALAATTGGQTTGVPTAIPIQKYNEEFYIKARRMIVVKQEKSKGRGYSKCVPIGTYGFRGVGKPGLRVEDHAAAYMKGSSPGSYAEEPEMSKKPIEIIPGRDKQSLHPLSRIDFGRTHTVNWNVKVVDVGMVSEKSMKYLSAYWADSPISAEERNLIHNQRE